MTTIAANISYTNIRTHNLKISRTRSGECSKTCVNKNLSFFFFKVGNVIQDEHKEYKQSSHCEKVLGTVLCAAV